jgi:hypothetical protein
MHAKPPMSTGSARSGLKARAFREAGPVVAAGEPAAFTENGEPRHEARASRPPRRQPLGALRGSVRRCDRPLDPVGDDASASKR